MGAIDANKKIRVLKVWLSKGIHPKRTAQPLWGSSFSGMGNWQTFSRRKWTMAERNWAYFSVCYGRAVLYIFLLNGHFKKTQTLQTSLKEIRNMSRSLTCLLTERLILKTDIPFNLAMQWFQVQFIQTCNMMVCVVHGVARSLHVSSNECRHPMQWWSLFWLEVLYDQTSSRF